MHHETTKDKTHFSFATWYGLQVTIFCFCFLCLPKHVFTCFFLSIFFFAIFCSLFRRLINLVIVDSDVDVIIVLVGQTIVSGKGFGWNRRTTMVEIKAVIDIVKCARVCVCVCVSFSSTLINTFKRYLSFYTSIDERTNVKI